MRSTLGLIRIASTSAILAAGLVSSRNALAEPDTFGIGSGRTGAGSIAASGTVVNAYASITANVATGATTITVDDGATFSPGDLALVWQTTGIAAAVSGIQTIVDLDSVSTGSFEYARVKSISGNVVTLTNAITNAAGYVGGTAQMVKVPEYTTLSIALGASVVATPWDGSKGGVAVVFATGTITNDGLIAGDGAGFRGGVLLNDPEIFECAANDGPVVDTVVPTGINALAGGAKKGEGLFPADFSTITMNPSDVANFVTYGRGNIVNGGGGGDCSNSGGGGGGHGNVGGSGGETWSGETPIGSRAFGGLGGAPLQYDPLTRLAFGGGGGAGEENNSVGGTGGTGGGVVMIRANAIAGTGLITSNGTAGANAANDGAGGGGAGGLVVVLVAADATCNFIRATGGAGGSCATDHGPGGGGAGGIVDLHSATATCPKPLPIPGNAGTDGAGLNRGATDGISGLAEGNPGAFSPTTCDIAHDKCGGCVIDSDCGSAATCDTTTNECINDDAGVADAGVDAGAADAGSSDGGSSSDGGTSNGADGGIATTDGGPGLGDGGASSMDGGGPGSDGELGEAGGDLEGGGCSTSRSSSDGDGALAFGIGLMVALAFKRRKRK